MSLSILRTAAEDRGKTKLCVIFKVDPEIAKQFPAERTKPDGSPSKMPPHCTLLFAELEPGERTMARNLIRQIAGKTEPFQIRLGGKGSFPNCVWVPVKGIAPKKLHDQMLTTLRNAGIEAPQTHDEYHPHCTIEYTEDPNNWKGTLPRGSFWVNEIEVWFGEERREHVYKLGTRLRKAPAKLVAAAMSSLPEQITAADYTKFRAGLEDLINTASVENGSDTPDFILAEYLSDCLAAFDKAVRKRARWYGRSNK